MKRFLTSNNFAKQLGNMEKFLQKVKDHPNFVENTRVLGVLGNEACDLDSAVSSVVYAFFLSAVQAYPGRVVLPVLNIPRSALRLRTEVVHMFKKESIPLESLICKDEIDLQSLYNRSMLELVLVDQNVLRGSDKILEPSVIEIMDHHKQECEPRETLQKVVIEPVGSCCTLIAERILQSKPDLLSSQVSLLLYSSILVDTTNLSEVTKRATPKDKEVVEKLEKILVGIDRKAIYDDVQWAKDSVEGFTLVDLLHKDQKVLSIGQITVAFSTLVVTLQDFVNKIQDPHELRGYCLTNGIHILVLLNSIIAEGSVMKEGAVYSPSEVATEKVCKILVESRNPDLSLQKKVIEGSPAGLKAFTQRNLTYTRKAVLPLVKESIGSQIMDFELLFQK